MYFIGQIIAYFLTEVGESSGGDMVMDRND